MMKQEITHRSENGLNKVSFQQKSTGLSLVITGSSALCFIARAWPIRSAAAASDAIASVFVEALTLFDKVTVAILGLALAEIVHSAPQLVYARR